MQLCRVCLNLHRPCLYEIVDVDLDPKTLLNCNPITDTSIWTLVKHCPKLESLSIKWETITDESMSPPSTLTTLKAVYFHFFENLTGANFSQVLLANRNLEKLTVSSYLDLDDLWFFISRQVEGAYSRVLRGLDNTTKFRCLACDFWKLHIVRKAQHRGCGIAFGTVLLGPTRRCCSHFSHLEVSFYKEAWHGGRGRAQGDSFNQVYPSMS